MCDVNDHIIDVHRGEREAGHFKTSTLCSQFDLYPLYFQLQYIYKMYIHNETSIRCTVLDLTCTVPGQKFWSGY